MNMSEINPPMIEKFKQKRLEGETMYKRKRNPATEVVRETSRSGMGTANRHDGDQ
jgi:hypothetical protein